MITKSDLSELLHGVFDEAVGEGEHFLDSFETYPKCAYWEYLWRDDMASGDDYEELVTYQVSVVSRRTRDPKLKILKSRLNAIGLHPDINHEYVKAQEGPGEYHSYFAVEVVEALTE